METETQGENEEPPPTPPTTPRKSESSQVKISGSAQLHPETVGDDQTTESPKDEVAADQESPDVEEPPHDSPGVSLARQPSHRSHTIQRSSINSAEIIARSIMADLLRRTESTEDFIRLIVQEVFDRAVGLEGEDEYGEEEPPQIDTVWDFIRATISETLKRVWEEEYRFRVKIGDKSKEKKKKVSTPLSEEMKICEQFAGVEKIAENLVKSVVKSSIKSISKHSPRKLKRNEDLVSLATVGTVDTCASGSAVSEISSSSTGNQTLVEILGDRVITWPTIKEFTVVLGKQKIIEYMAYSWEYTEQWMFCVDFLVPQSDESSDFYLYEAKWSIPTNPYPVPQAYVAIYFTIEVSRVKPDQCPVEVTYVFEGQSFVHHPGSSMFQERWLFNVIDAKLKFYKSLTF